MAKLSPGLLLADPKQQFSIYTMKGCDKLILRRKGGASKKRIQKDPAFKNTRLNNAEFGGRATASKWIRKMLQPVKFIADYNFTGPLNSLLKPIQELDTVHDYGERSIAISANPGLLEGLNLNRKTPFETIVQNPLHYTLSKKKLQASIELPALLPGVNFTPGNFSLYRFIVSLGIIPDLFYNSYRYFPKGNYADIEAEMAFTRWFSTQTGSPAARLTLQLPDKLPNNAYSIMLATGIAFGTLRNGEEEPLHYVGGAKILAMA